MAWMELYTALTNLHSSALVGHHGRRDDWSRHVVALLCGRINFGVSTNHKAFASNYPPTIENSCQSRKSIAADASTIQVFNIYLKYLTTLSVYVVRSILFSQGIRKRR